MSRASALSPLGGRTGIVASRVDVMRTGVASAREHDEGQSLVELALALPVLLLIVLGMTDVGRLLFQATSVMNAAREAALYAATTSSANCAMVAQRACDELGTAGCACSPSATIRVEYTVDVGTAPTRDEVRVSVTRDVDLLFAYLVQRIVQVNPRPVSATVTVPRLSP